MSGARTDRRRPVGGISKKVEAQVVAPAQLAAAAERVAPHLRPILSAAADGLVAFAHIAQHQGQFRFVSKRPVVLIVGDDYDFSYGPQAFHLSSVRRFVRNAASAVIVSGAPEPRVYLAAVAAAIMTGRDVAIIETVEAHEPAWLALARDARPDIKILLSTPGRGGGGLQ